MTDSDITRPIGLPHADTPPAVTLLDAAVQVARDNRGVTEQGGSNRGPIVDTYIRSVGLDPERGSYPWCAAFVHFCFEKAGRALGLPAQPCPKVAGVMRLWNLSEERFRLGWGVVKRNPEMLRPGQVFIEDHGEGKGHAGIVLAWVGPPGGNLVRTISGNTNAVGSREGNAVVEQNRSTDRWLGLLDFGR